MRIILLLETEGKNPWPKVMLAFAYAACRLRGLEFLSNERFKSQVMKGVTDSYGHPHDILLPECQRRVIAQLFFFGNLPGLEFAISD
ncbi:MAG TPA: hypothetical protein PLI05_07160 [Methanotrichaceae archaeon]|nr:hypothetical protein [Methanotrichaceae archaeon]HQF16828.1 hypothetical protein [Methanotrichaceae archaeon]HQI90154.1 hypothetical protein [Methanotrichaceae archaeon]HQJ29124.1 hypothetical protein [Methanotrichaceae archaeon]